MLARIAPTLLPLLLCACDADPRPKSVLLVVVDTLRADHLGAYGHARNTSPHLDARVPSGLLFERAWATSSWTLPSMASIYTGELPSRHQAGGRVSGQPGGHRALSAQTPTLAELLAERGFETGAIASNPFLHRTSGTARGFRHYDFVSVNNKRIRRADVAVDRALAWLRERGEAPFFFVLHLFDPHMNYDPVAPARGQWTAAIDSQLSLPVKKLNDLRSGELGLDSGDVDFLGAAYDEEIANVDHELARLWAWLDSSGRADDVLVALTADHGEELFEHGGFEHGHAMWEEVLHVPLVLWGPGVRAGRSRAPVSIADLMPTILDSVGVAPLPDVYGASLWAHASRGELLPERDLVAEGTLYGAGAKAMLRGESKLIRRGGGSPLLFDLGADAAEQRDLSADRSQLLAEMEADLTRHVEDSRATTLSPAAELDERTRADLRSLGYTK